MITRKPKIERQQTRKSVKDSSLLFRLRIESKRSQESRTSSLLLSHYENIVTGNQHSKTLLKPCLHVFQLKTSIFLLRNITFPQFLCY